MGLPGGFWFSESHEDGLLVWGHLLVEASSVLGHLAEVALPFASGALFLTLVPKAASVIRN